MITPWRILAAGAAIAVLVGLTLLSRLPLAMDDSDGGLLRLSWRARGETIERCHRATPAELAGVPAHMRQAVICEGVHVAPYRLRVALDGHPLEDGLVAGSGVPGDRPMYLLREFELSPGPHRFEVLFEKRSARDDDEARPDDDSSGREHAQEARRRAVPPRLSLDTTLMVAAGAVVLITYSSELRRLEVLGAR